jgi:hypothetical protein
MMRVTSARSFCLLLCRRSASKAAKPKDETEINEIDAVPLSKELKKRWSYFIRKVYETDPLTCPKCQGEMWFDELTTLRGLEGRIISFIDQPEVIKKILQHLGLWEEPPTPPGRYPAIKELTFDPSYGSINSPSRERSRDSQVI